MDMVIALNDEAAVRATELVKSRELTAREVAAELVLAASAGACVDGNLDVGLSLGVTFGLGGQDVTPSDDTFTTVGGRLHQDHPEGVSPAQIKAALLGCRGLLREVSGGCHPGDTTPSFGLCG